MHRRNKMEDIDQFIPDHDEFYNYIFVLIGLSVTVDGLQEYVKTSLQTLLNEIQDRHKAIPRCNKNCSRKFGQKFSDWCDACSEWRYDLEGHKRNDYQQTIWKSIDSFDWSKSFEEVGKVYLKDIYPMLHGTFHDLGSILSLFRNCSIFKINIQVVKDVGKYRNNLFAHNFTLRVSTVDKLKCLNCLAQLFRVSEIMKTNDGKLALDKLTQLLSTKISNNKILKLAQDVSETIENEVDVKYVEILESSKNDIDGLSSYESMKYHETTLFILKLKQLSGENRLKFCQYWIKFSTLVSIIFSVMVLGSLLYGYYSDDRENITTGCLVMDKGVWEMHSNFDLNVYMGEIYNETVIERKWIYMKIKENMFLGNKGVNLIADPGYGKTSIVSQLICAEHSSPWFNFRNHILAYHICRFDRSTTQNTAIFIKSFAMAIIRTFPIVGNALYFDQMFQDYMYGIQCSVDPMGCFENMILRPLRTYANELPPRRYIFIIDALDECETNERYDILDILSAYIDKFPSQFHFLLTSRNIEGIKLMFKCLTAIHLNDYIDDIRNDILSYISIRNISMSRVQHSELVNLSDGNFLYVKYLLDYCSTEPMCRASDVPSSLGDMFELNLKRVFGKNVEKFEQIKPIFEVLTVVSMPISEESLIEISGIDTERKNLFSIVGKELRHFVRITNNNSVCLSHKSLSDFLTNYSRRHSLFYIDKSKGFKRFANYLIKNLNTAKDVNIVDLAHLVALSKSTEFEDIFLSYAYHMQSVNSSFLHTAARKYNCYGTIQLLLQLVCLSNIDEENRHNLTASFIAAEHGNDETLRALLDHGANIDFKVQCNLIIKCVFGKNILRQYIAKCMCEYSLLDIAMQNWHSDVVRLLLTRNPSFLHHRNGNGLNALQIASENGNIEIIKIILNINRSLADSFSLYVAALHGFQTPVEVMLEYGVKDDCMPCDGHVYGTNGWTERTSQQKYTCSVLPVNYTQFKNMLISPYDWRRLTCMTALHVAVINGNVNIVKLLLKQRVNSLECRNYAGMTPIYLAAQHKQIKIFKLLYKKGASLLERCKIPPPLHLHERRFLCSYFMDYDNHLCNEGSSIMHILAIHNNVQITRFLINRGFSEWMFYDSIKASTLHYALGYRSYKFINEIENKINLSTALLQETIRGHTPYHFALECKYTSIGHVIVGGETHEDRDIYGRSPLQMAVQYMHFLNQRRCIRHITMAISAGCNVHHVDNFENNFLHYIARKNNSHLFYHVLTSNILKAISKLLRQRNVMGHTPLMVAATYYSDHNIDIDKFFQNIMASSSDIWENDSEIRIGSGLRYLNSFWKSYFYIRDNLHINIPKQDLKMIIEAIIYNTNISN